MQPTVLIGDAERLGEEVPMKLVACIPNLSEGRDRGILADLAAAFDAVDDVALLHLHPDDDHNRTVFTTVGDPPALVRAVEELYARALDRIDMRAQQGVHPRVGAVDVCPFVPLPDHGTSMADCVALARQLAERVGERFRLPVFLYREAATAAHRRDLTAARRGQFEGLTEKLRDPDWRPDFGPARHHPSAGATIIGARGPLIAFNVVLDGDDLKAAREIAAGVRQSSGGLPCIKAMGVRLASRNLVQVSMNVENFKTTPLVTAYEAVREAAARRGLSVVESELVGLAPREALRDAERLRLVGFGADRVLENAIRDWCGGAAVAR